MTVNELFCSSICSCHTQCDHSLSRRLNPFRRVLLKRGCKHALSADIDIDFGLDGDGDADDDGDDDGDDDERIYHKDPIHGGESRMTFQ